MKRSSQPASREAWRTAVANAGANGEAKLIAAVKAFAVDPDLKRGDFGAPAFQRWLEERRFLSYLAAADDAAGSARSHVAAVVPDLPSPPAELIASFVERFPRVWLPDGWIEAERVLVTRLAFSRDRVRVQAADWLAENAVTVISAAEFASAQPSSGSRP